MMRNSSIALNAPKTDEKLGLKEILLYNLMAIPLNAIDMVIMTWVMYVYIPPQGVGKIQYVSIGVIGFILAAGRILDAVTDLLVGYMSDNLKSRWGRRKPFIFISLPILCITFVMVWSPPVQGISVWNGVFLAVVLFFYYWAYTGVLIPWFAVLPEMSRHNKERIKISTIGVALIVVGVLLGGGLSGPLIEQFGPLKMAIIIGVICLVIGEIAILGINERYEPKQDEITPNLKDFGKAVKQIFKDKQVFSFLIMVLLAQMTYQLMVMNTPYISKLILGKSEAEASILLAQIILTMALSTPLWYWLLNKFPKRTVFRFILLSLSVFFCAAFFIGKYPVFSPSTQALIIFCLLIIPYGGMFAAVTGLIADISDYDELKSKHRREAIYYGIYGLVRKTGWAFCSMIVAWIFSLFGYSAENPMGVRVVYLVCSGACFLAFLAFIPYKLGDSKEETKSIMGL